MLRRDRIRWGMTEAQAARRFGVSLNFYRALLIVGLSLTLLQSCSQNRDVLVSNGCEEPLGLAFFGGVVAPSNWGPNVTIPAKTQELRQNALPGSSGDVGMVRLESPDGSSHVLQIGREPGDPVVLNLQCPLQLLTHTAA
jgi:hypothetical protein